MDWHVAAKNGGSAVLHLLCALQRLLNHIKPDKVHVMESGKIIFSGDISIADILEAEGYEGIKKAIKQQGTNGAVQQRQPAMSGNPD